jgi:hypothetical protein
MGIVFLFPATPKVDVADMNYTIVVLGGALFLSLVYYYLPVYGGKNWFTGPVATVDVPGCSPGAEEGEEKEKATVEIVQSK